LTPDAPNMRPPATSPTRPCASIAVSTAIPAAPRRPHSLKSPRPRGPPLLNRIASYQTSRFRSFFFLFSGHP
jgi:hypothetical protein